MQLELICPSSSFIGGGGVWPAVMCAFAPMIARGGPTRGVLAGVWTEDLLQFSEISAIWTHKFGATRNQKRQIWAGTCDETLFEADANSEAGKRRVTGCSLPARASPAHARARARPFASHASAALTLDCARHALVAIRVTIVTPHRFKRCGLSQERAAAALRPLMSPPVTAQTSSD